jgi:hypothetical protein
MDNMLDYSPKSPTIEKKLLDILEQLEKQRGRRVLCFYQDHLKNGEMIDDNACEKTLMALRELGKQDKLAVVVESPGGDIDCTYRIVRSLRRNAQDVEILVARWAKSAATFFCLGADTIYMGQDAELGPLDTQLHDPKGSAIPKSALNAFKSLEYLRQYMLETLDLVVGTLIRNGGMDIPYAIEAARPLVADIVGPLYRQVDPHELGEARRYLAVGEEYSKKIMQRYSYKHRKAPQIDKIVEQLVWHYPSHGYVIDMEEAQNIGLSAQPLDDTTEGLLVNLFQLVHNCYGFRPMTTSATSPVVIPAKSKPKARSTDVKK